MEQRKNPILGAQHQTSVFCGGLDVKEIFPTSGRE